MVMPRESPPPTLASAREGRKNDARETRFDDKRELLGVCSYPLQAIAWNLLAPACNRIDVRNENVRSISENKAGRTQSKKHSEVKPDRTLEQKQQRYHMTMAVPASWVKENISPASDVATPNTDDDLF